jgi:hypothetical protein
MRPFLQDSTCVGARSPAPVRISIALTLLMVSQGSLRRADNPLPQPVLTIWTQNYPPCASQVMYHKHADSSRQRSTPLHLR